MPTAYTAPQAAYADMGRRVIAFVIDLIIISIPLTAVFAAFSTGFGTGEGSRAGQVGYPGDLSGDLVRDATGTGTVYLLYALVPLVTIFYFAISESSKAQATFGKRIMGIKVVNRRGEDMNFANAFLRAGAKFFVSGILFIGYLMAFFDPERRALHDRWAGTHVVNR